MATRRVARVIPPVQATPVALKAADVSIEEVTGSARGRDEFITFPLSHYRGDPLFVQPIVAERRDFLNERLNPFFQHATMALWVARRGGRVVGRIAAVMDERYNRFHGLKDGLVGFFESQNDPGISAGLFEAAAAWLRQRGLARVVGPVNLGFQYDCGVLVDGFERLPSMMMTYNPRFYAHLFEASGFTRLKDLFSYELWTSQGLPEKVVRLAQRVRQSGRVRVRRLNTARPQEEIERIKTIYETMLRPGFGFPPMSDAELLTVVQRIHSVILMRPELSLIAEADGEAVAFGITIPDANVALKAAQGYLLPTGLLRMVWAARSIDRLRVLLFGIKQGWRRRGIDALLALETFERARALGYVAGELGWVVEDDTLINRTIQATGARRIKTYRIFQRTL